VWVCGMVGRPWLGANKMVDGSIRPSDRRRQGLEPRSPETNEKGLRYNTEAPLALPWHALTRPKIPSQRKVVCVACFHVILHDREDIVGKIKVIR
jgi:hypothetical protein